MADHGGDNGTNADARRSRLAEYAETTRPAGDVVRPPEDAVRLPEEAARPSGEATEPSPAPADTTAARREFAALVGEFRRTAVLVPLDGDDEAPLTGDLGGVRWIYTFTDEAALARFAIARGQQDREWTYRQVLGARLLDVAVPAAGVPCGVAVDVGSEDGVLLPPVAGVVPEAVAVHTYDDGEARR
ncbi:hypothetical protein ACLGIH_11945 [Streptomyces sp. HMX87]|uniref:hypothetical protein n=1 Tax=Streptomyces sp. HMX87 TaxID=3390849 RepID=UPI003A899BE0